MKRFLSKGSFAVLIMVFQLLSNDAFAFNINAASNSTVDTLLKSQCASGTPKEGSNIEVGTHGHTWLSDANQSNGGKAVYRCPVLKAVAEERGKLGTVDALKTECNNVCANAGAAKWSGNLGAFGGSSFQGDQVKPTCICNLDAAHWGTSGCTLSVSVNVPGSTCDDIKGVTPGQWTQSSALKPNCSGTSGLFAYRDTRACSAAAPDSSVSCSKIWSQGGGKFVPTFTYKIKSCP